MNYNITIVLAILVFVVISALSIVRKFRRAYIVPQGYAGLLYGDGKFLRVLGAGRHVIWGRNLTLSPADLRKAFINVTGQEVLTADNVSLKASLLISYQVSDPIKAAHETQNWQADVYNAAQLALRSVLSSQTSEGFLTTRPDLAPQLLLRVQPETAKVGVTVLGVEIKDVMLPGDLKRAYSDVLKAKQEGQAALERARGESAALRNLANAARLLDGNPALLNLRMLQSLAAAQGAGNTLVLGVPGGFVPLKNGHAPQQSNQT